MEFSFRGSGYRTGLPPAQEAMQDGSWRGANFRERARYTAVDGATMLRAILTDSHFWVPFVVLGLGIVLLLRLV